MSKRFNHLLQSTVRINLCINIIINKFIHLYISQCLIPLDPGLAPLLKKKLRMAIRQIFGPDSDSYENP